ncbi:hypothetical protein EDB81DRAFT_902039, partial [Dactylonectria macrodidyma]
MSWLCRDPEIIDDDLETVTFEPGENRVFTIERKDGVSVSSKLLVSDNTKEVTLSTEDEWQEWLDQVRVSLHKLLRVQLLTGHQPDKKPSKNPSDGSSCIDLILGSRAERPWGEDPGLVSALPWSKDIFFKVKSQFLIHGQIIRTINRNTSCITVYNCRSAASWPQDMALSVTFLPDSLTTRAVLFGCDLKTPDRDDESMTLGDIIIGELSRSDSPVLHPMLLPAIFADIERDRQIELVREKLIQLRRIVYDLASVTSQPTNLVVGAPKHTKTAKKRVTQMIRECLQDLRKSFSKPATPTLASEFDTKDDEETEKSSCSPLEMKKDKMPTTMLWLEVSRLRLGLGNWQRQLNKMIDHIEELDTAEFDSDKVPRSGVMQDDMKRQQFRESGIRIKERLQELVDEYDEYIRECSHILDGMSLATQLELSHIGRSDARTNLNISEVNLEVAQMTRRDSSVMKSIAILGMVFLPATFVTAFFSMGFFDWNGDEPRDGVQSEYIWIYALAVVALTLLSVGLF